MFVDRGGMGFAEANEVDNVGEDFDSPPIGRAIQIRESQVVDAALSLVSLSLPILSPNCKRRGLYQPTTTNNLLNVINNPIKSLVSAVYSLSASGPANSSAAALIAGLTTSLVVFMIIKTKNSNIFWTCCGFGLRRSSRVQFMPISVMHVAISGSGCRKYSC